MKQSSKEKILEKAILAMSRAPQSSMEQIAVQSGVSRATLYRYFRTREAMLKEMTEESGRLFDRIIDPIAAMDIPAKEKLEKFVKEFVSAGARFHFLLYNDMYLMHEEIKGIYDSQMEKLKRLAADLKKEGGLDSGVPDEWAAVSLEFLMYAAWEKVHQGDIALNKAAGLILQTYLKGIGK